MNAIIPLRGSLLPANLQGGDSGVPMLFGSLTNEYYQMCINAMGADADVDTAALFIDRLSGAQVVPPASNV